MDYRVICVFCNEDARWESKLLPDSLMTLLCESGAVGRCLVIRGIMGSF